MTEHNKYTNKINSTRF